MKAGEDFGTRWQVPACLRRGGFLGSYSLGVAPQLSLLRGHYALAVKRGDQHWEARYG